MKNRYLHALYLDCLIIFSRYFKKYFDLYKPNKILFVIVLSVISFLDANASKTTGSVQDGNWSNDSTWSNGVPNVNNDSILIYDTVDASTINLIVFGSQSTLIVENNAVLYLDSAEFKNGSFIWIKAGGTLIVYGDLTNHNNSYNVIIDGTLIVNGTLANGSGGEISGSGSISAGDWEGECCIMGFDPDSLNPGDSITDSIIWNPLPVEIAYFNTQCNNNHCNIIEWGTFSETNCYFFSLYRTSDFSTWQIVANITGSGNSNNLKSYKVNDCEIQVRDKVLYYKLLQYNYNGSFHESGIIHSSCNYLNKHKIFVYPNPLPQGSILFVYKNTGEPVDYQIFDILGNRCTIDQLSTGIYFIKAENEKIKLAVQ